MPLRRHFLAARTPALGQAVDWLAGHRPPGEGPWDLHDVTVAVPGRRAVRRLTERLVERAGDAGLLSPTVVTAGQLPEQLCEPLLPVAGELIANLAWIRAARDTDGLAALLPHQPADDDLASWWPLAESFRAVVADLAAAGVEPADVPRSCADRGFPLPEPERWEALADLDFAHAAQLAGRGVVERHGARRAALDESRCAARGEVVLLGVTDLPPLLADILRAVAGDAEVTALVVAPESLADAFDDLGGLRVDAWHDRWIDLPDDRVHFVDTPFDQGRRAAAVLAERSRPGAAGDPPRFRVDDVTVGLGDEGDAAAVRYALELAGLPTRYAAGRPMTQAPPATFLAGLAQLAARQRVRDLADLLRHPDVEAWLHRAGGDATDWLSRLDRYAAEHLQDRITGDWLGDPGRAGRLGFLWRRVSGLLPEAPERPRPLPEWCGPVREALGRLYGSRSLERDRPEDRAVLRSLECLCDLLSEQEQLAPEDALTPVVPFAGAVDLLLRRLEGEALPEEADRPAAELLGFLELPLDDGPMLVVTGVNEGGVPRVVGGDAILPDGLRRVLGLDDDRRRYAHAVCAVHAILQTRAAVDFVATRWSADREPLVPARLLLAGDADTRLRRLDGFYRAVADPAAADRDLPLLLAPGQTTGFFPPPPPADDATPLPERLGVTAFRDYLACPYRFYLRRVLRLTGPDEAGDEMDGSLFGELAHAALQAFGASGDRDTGDAGVIEDVLLQALSEKATARFGPRPRPAVAVQLDQLRHRLRTFARHQAASAGEGWRIDRVELDLEAPFDVDGQPFTLTGRIDRIDVHEGGRVRIVDYKTSDTRRTPEQVHRARGEWIDLQLPLYRELARPLGLREPELAYCVLPRRPEEAGLLAAPWSPAQVDDAVETAREVVRRIRRRAFWPPGDPARYADEFVRLCADEALDRAALVERSTAHGAAGG